MKRDQRLSCRWGWSLKNHSKFLHLSFIDLIHRLFIRQRIIWDSKRPEELTTHQQNEIQRRHLLLLRELKRFRNLQAIYMPAATVLAGEREASQ